MDTKYGRIFTEADLIGFVQSFALEGGLTDDQVKAAIDLYQSFTIPADEPTFLIRGKDKAAPNGVRAYANVALDIGATFEFAQRASHLSASMNNWQMNNHDRVKIPD